MKHLPFGLRTIKTALSVALSVLLVRFLSTEADAMFSAALGGLVAMDTTFRRSLQQGLTQFLGVLLGTGVGYFTHYFFPTIPRPHLSLLLPFSPLPQSILLPRQNHK